MASGARFGSVAAGLDGFSVTFDASRLVALTDRVTNQFYPETGKFQTALASVHAAAAEVVAQGMVDRLQRKVDAKGRPQRGNDRLAMSLLDPENAEWSANRFIVGKESWLERSPAALYWRGIEEGIGAYTTQALFTNTNGPPWAGPYYRPNRKFRGDHLRMRQGVGPRGIKVRAFDGYRYSQGGADALQRFDMADRYRIALAAVGIDMSKIPPRSRT